MKSIKLNKKTLIVTIIVVIGILIAAGGGYAQSFEARGKLTKQLRNKLSRARGNDEFKILIRMRDNPGATSPNGRLVRPAGERRHASRAIREMRSAARASQENIDGVLEAERNRGRVRGIRKFWIVNMMSCTATEDAINRLGMQDDVVSIYEDKIVRLPEIETMGELELLADISDDHTWGADRINTSAFWDQGYYGAGVVVGSIDTGVYAEHPDLAGKMAAIGNGSAGWYDAFGLSPLPVDDLGHGTHTIGIMVGGSENESAMTIGVAPDAKYYSARIFMRGEDTYNSTVLHAAEWMLDPDGDPSTDDFPDIICGSWGSTDPGSSDEWFREMVQSWRDVGIIPVFAAGNKGPGAGSVSDPGNYPESFSVGAVDITDKIMDFSSRGPAQYDGREIVKPDIAAPGDYIISALATGSEYDIENGSHKIGNDLFWSNGTSAAAPYVAGACALIKEKYPDFSGDDIVNLLCGTASDLGESVFAQGNGMLDLTEASEATAVFRPGVIYLGENEDETQQAWNTQAQIEIKNLTQLYQTYSIVLQGGLPEGLTAQITPSLVALAPGGSETLTLYISVDNTVFADMLEAPYIYRFRIIATSSNDTVTAYFMFKNGLDLRLDLDMPCDEVIVHDRAEWKDVEYNTAGSTQLMINILKPGIYDLIMTFKEDGVIKYVIKEGVELFDDLDMRVSADEASNRVFIMPRDKEGYELPATAYRGLEVKHKIFPAGTDLTLEGEEVFVSDLSGDYVLKWTAVDSVNGEYYFLSGRHETGVTRDIILSNDPLEIKAVSVTYNNYSQYARLYVEDFFNGGREARFAANEPEAPFVVDYYFCADQSMDDPYRFSSKVYSEDFLTSIEPDDSLLYETQFIDFPDQNTVRMQYIERGMGFEESDACKTMYETHANKLFFGFGPPHFTGKMDNTNLSIILKTAHWGGEDAKNLSNTLYLNQMYDRPEVETIDFELYRNNVLLDEGGLDLAIMPSWVASASRRGNYTVVLKNQYSIAGEIGQGITTLEFDKSSTVDKNPPHLLGLQILSGDDVTECINTSRQNKVKFKVGDNRIVTRANLYYRIPGEEWSELVLELVNGEYMSLLPRLPEGVADIKITARDGTGNSITYELSPAFKIETALSMLLGDVTGNGDVSSYDASLAAQYSINLISLPPDAVQRADVTGNGDVSSYDASLIAQYAIGLIDGF
ncbi:MAG: S8 family serine peptidase [Candidatus Omnitrophica bacterium]|nr:S8 family serine peptidase [Candidatus Omnitrophota bacterium]